MVGALRVLAADEQQRLLDMSTELRRLFEQRVEARNDQVQQLAIDEAIEELERQRTAHERAHRTRDLDPSSPYFGHLVLEEDGKRRQVLIAKGSAVDSRLPANVVDWRNAPISQLYYEHQQGDEFWIELAGREREGTVAARRTLDIKGGVLQGADDGTLVARKRAGNVWEVKDRAEEVLERSDVREDPDDHALPDIIALITRDQFQVLTRPESGVVILRGQAGSGKTTVALHRIAYLRYHDPERFRLDRILVVMFNKALQTYIRKALSDLDIEGVQVSTFHRWAMSMLSAAGHQPRFRAGAPEAVHRFKAHPAMESLLRARARRLGVQLEDWLVVPPPLSRAWAETEGSGLRRVAAFFARRSAPERRQLAGLRDTVFQRLHNHRRDLYALLDDRDTVATLPRELMDSVDVVARHLQGQRAHGHLDFADAALLLRFGQIVAEEVPELDLPWHHRLAHIVVDEAQDLSAPAIRVLLDAADAHRSVTLAGDPAQTLYGANDFGLLSGGIEALDAGLSIDALPIGHRSTRPIMELALRASGHTDPDLLLRTRPGNPVVWLRGHEADATVVAAHVDAFLARRPKALVAVLTRTRAEADAWAGELSTRATAPVRRGHRDDFAFQPGIVVANVHQVKGLEFDGVVVVEPGAYAVRERNLLHVAVTRAADQLWIVSRGHAGLVEPQSTS